MKHNERGCCLHNLSVIVAWLIGLLLGAILASGAEGYLPRYMRLLCADQIPLIGMIILLTLPLVISAYLLYHRVRFLVFLIITLKATFYSFCFYGFLFTYQNAGWLAVCLFMFSTSCSAVMLLHFLLKHIHCCCISRKVLQMYILILASLVITDYYVISPFAAVFY